MEKKGISRDLMLAILSMDTYNREYDRSVKVSGTAVGDAKIMTRDRFDVGNDVYANWMQQGFYAIAYDTSKVGSIGDARTIAYRGTNFNGLFDSFDSPVWRDIKNGWVVGTGWPGGQAALGLDFFNAVAGAVDPRQASIGTTGHSLGGGLAGLAANVYGRKSVLFDHMPYGPASLGLQALALVDQATRDRFFRGGDAWTFVSKDITALSVEYEVLSALRLNAITDASKAMPSYGGLRSPLDLHSMAMLALLIWAKDNGHTKWQSVGRELWDSFSDKDVANAIPDIQDFVGVTGTPTSVMQTVIAYSVLDSGEKPFGDTAVWALFDDADELGSVIAADPAAIFGRFVKFEWLDVFGIPIPTLTYKDVKQSLTDFAMQFAGGLAIRDVEGDEVAKEGVLGLAPDGNTLVFDASDHVWAVAGGPEPVNLGNFRDTFFAQTDEN